MIAVLILSFQGPSAALVFPLRDPSLIWFDELFNPRRTGDIGRRLLPLDAAGADRDGADGADLGDGRLRLPPALPRARASIFYMAIASLIVPGLVLSIGILVTFRYLGLPAAWYTLGARRASLLDAAVRPADHVRGARPAQPVLRGGGLRPRRQQVADGQGGRPADRASPASSRSRCSASRSPTTSSRAAG